MRLALHLPTHQQSAAEAEFCPTNPSVRRGAIRRLARCHSGKVSCAVPRVPRRERARLRTCDHACTAVVQVSFWLQARNHALLADLEGLSNLAECKSVFLCSLQSLSLKWVSMKPFIFGAKPRGKVVADNDQDTDMTGVCVRVCQLGFVCLDPWRRS